MAFAAMVAAPIGALADEMPMEGHETIESRGGQRMSNVGAPLPKDLQGKPVLVRIHADWCSACKETESTLASVTKQYGNRITYVRLDVTNAKTASDAQAQAQKMGLGKFFDATKAATSTVAVIDPKTGNVIAELYDDNDAHDYSAAIAKALKAMGKS